MNSIVELWPLLADKYGSQIALKDETTGYSLTFNQINKNIDRTVNILRKLNIKKYDKILIFLSPHPLWHVINQAIMKNNNISVPCDPLSNFNEIIYILSKTKSNVLFTDNLQFIQYLNNKVNTKKFIIFYVGKDNITNLKIPNIKIYNFFDLLKNSNSYIKTTSYCADDLAIIIYSSGTTGEPKGIINTHYNLLLFCYDHAKMFPENANKKKCINIHSSSHVASFAHEIAFLYKGNTIIYSTYGRYLTTIQKYKPEYLFCVPTLLNRIKIAYEEILNNTNKKYKCVSKNIVNKLLNPSASIYIFGAAVPKEIKHFFDNLKINLVFTYSCSELFSCITCCSSKYKNMNYVNSSADIIIYDSKTGKKLGTNKSGVIKIKTKTLFKGYYKNEKKTKEAFDKDGYFITGDLGYIREDGFLCVEGRNNDILVLNNGEKVNSLIVENICNKSKFINQIVVFGHNKPYLTALVTINKEYVDKWSANENINISTKKGKSLLKKEIIMNINDLIGKEKFFKWIQEIRNITILKQHFTRENGLLTQKNTIAKSKVYNKYKELIFDMYN